MRTAVLTTEEPSSPAAVPGMTAPPGAAPAASPVLFPHAAPDTDSAHAEKNTQPDTIAPWNALIARLAGEGFDADKLRHAFAALHSPPLPLFMAQKAVELHGGKASLALDEQERVAFAPPDYTRLAGGMSIASGRRAIGANSALFQGLYRRYGVPAPFITAVLMVETGLGAELGRQPALLALGSMAVTDSLEQVLPVVRGITPTAENLNERLRERSAWAYTELKALLQYADKTGKEVWRIPGSVYGAIGICQFMPSNIPAFGASARARDAEPDLFSLPDAAASVARYLSAHGWKNAATPQAQVAVLRTYNHSDVYASTVYGVAVSLISPTTHLSAQSARKGTNAVSAARENARAGIPAGNKKAKPLEGLGAYGTLFE